MNARHTKLHFRRRFDVARISSPETDTTQDACRIRCNRHYAARRRFPFAGGLEQALEVCGPTQPRFDLAIIRRSFLFARIRSPVVVHTGTNTGESAPSKGRQRREKAASSNSASPGAQKGTRGHVFDVFSLPRRHRLQQIESASSVT